MNVLRHAAVTALLFLATLGIPAAVILKNSSGENGIDAVSSATVVIEQPSGAYVVLINRDLHMNEDNLKVWESFFRGEEIDFLFEDISCIAGEADNAGLGQAKSFQSRLPENQMKVRTEDDSLLLSKLSEGYFDVIIMSAEFYEAYKVSGFLYGNTDIIKGEKK